MLRHELVRWQLRDEDFIRSHGDHSSLLTFKLEKLFIVHVVKVHVRSSRYVPALRDKVKQACYALLETLRLLPVVLFVGNHVLLLPVLQRNA